MAQFPDLNKRGWHVFSHRFQWFFLGSLVGGDKDPKSHAARAREDGPSGQNGFTEEGAEGSRSPGLLNAGRLAPGSAPGRRVHPPKSPRVSFGRLNLSFWLALDAFGACVYMEANSKSARLCKRPYLDSRLLGT